jgi:hypothetical protein
MEMALNPIDRSALELALGVAAHQAAGNLAEEDQAG